MGRIVFISHRHDDLVPTIIKKVPEAVALTSFKLEIQRGDVLCWLPTVNEFFPNNLAIKSKRRTCLNISFSSSGLVLNLLYLPYTKNGRRLG